MGTTNNRDRKPSAYEYIVDELQRRDLDLRAGAAGEMLIPDVPYVGTQADADRLFGAGSMTVQPSATPSIYATTPVPLNTATILEIAAKALGVPLDDVKVTTPEPGLVVVGIPGETSGKDATRARDALLPLLGRETKLLVLRMTVDAWTKYETPTGPVIPRLRRGALLFPSPARHVELERALGDLRLLRSIVGAEQVDRAERWAASIRPGIDVTTDALGVAKNRLAGGQTIDERLSWHARRYVTAADLASALRPENFGVGTAEADEHLRRAIAELERAPLQKLPVPPPTGSGHGGGHLTIIAPVLGPLGPLTTTFTKPHTLRLPSGVEVHAPVGTTARECAPQRPPVGSEKYLAMGWRWDESLLAWRSGGATVRPVRARATSGETASDEPSIAEAHAPAEPCATPDESRRHARAHRAVAEELLGPGRFGGMSIPGRRELARIVSRIAEAVEQLGCPRYAIDESRQLLGALAVARLDDIDEGSEQRLLACVRGALVDVERVVRAATRGG